MCTPHQQAIRAVTAYYHSIESFLGYMFVLGGVRRYGYHPEPVSPLTIREAQDKENNLIADVLKIKPGENVLELGCGEGSSANYIALLYGCQITGIDLLPGSIRIAQRTANKQGLKNAFRVGDYSRLPFPDNTFDAVYAIETLVHAPLIGNVFSEVNRVLKPGGRFAFCEYSIASDSELGTDTLQLINFFISGGAMYALPELRHNSVVPLVKQAGFINADCRNILPNALPTARYLAERAKRPYKVIQRLRLQKYFVNATTAVESYRIATTEPDAIHYNLVTAHKSL